MKIEAYWIETGETPEELAAEVERKLGDGWEICGGLQVVGGRWCQVLVKPGPKPPAKVYYKATADRPGHWGFPGEDGLAGRDAAVAPV